MRVLFIAGSILIGSLLVVWALRDLKESGNTAYHNNPFGLKLSGYGTILARLSQRNLDRAFHNGVVANESSKRVKGEDDGDDHGEEGEHGEEGGHGEKSEEKHEEDNDPAHEHDHNHETEDKGNESFIEPALNFLVNLDAERFRRTSPFTISDTHQKAITLDIEKLLLRSYNMDPTDFGVYSSYFHFLTLHEMRGDPEAIKHALKISKNTIKLVQREVIDPMPWLTAATAVLDQFLMAQAELRKQNLILKKQGLTEKQLPEKNLISYRDGMGFCLNRYGTLRDLAVKEGRWSVIPQDRRDEAEDRAYTAIKMHEQFDAMIKRQKK